MKRFYIMAFLLQSIALCGHGFANHTFVLLAHTGWQQIDSLCHRAQKEKISITSYDSVSSFHTNAHIVRGGRSTTKCYIRCGFEKHLKNSENHEEIKCTPTQEFFNASTGQWIPAYMLKEGDNLLCAENVSKTVAYVELVKKEISIYTVEVEHTHTFFVTRHSVLTHNMVLPIAFSVGLSIPFGAGAAGTLGSFFGPVTLVAGAALGCMAGLLVTVVCGDRVPTYTIDTYNANKFEQYVKQQPTAMYTDVTVSEPNITYSANYVTIQHHAPITDTHADKIPQEYTIQPDDTDGPSLSLIVSDPSKSVIACGDTTPHKPLILVTPAEPMPTFQCPGYRPLSDEERKMLSGSCITIPIPESERGSSIICGGIVPVSIDASDLIMTATHSGSKQDIKSTRYDGPTYTKTEDWIKASPVGKEFARTKQGFQGKRAFKLKRNILGISGISEGDCVVIDAAHGDHLEVYNQKGRWIHVIDFDGSKNETKTKQAEKKPRMPLKNL